jgi:LCP family protein required for cell wall assembly
MTDRHRPRGAELRFLLVAALLAGCATGTPSPSTTPVPTLEATPTLVPSAVPTPTSTPAPIPVHEQMLARRFTVLVAGEDTSSYRRAHGVKGWRTDALMVISVSADKSKIAMISLPRDTVDVPMANGVTYHGKVNGISESFGLEALRGAMATLLGVPIDRYIRVDMDDFSWLVDAVGGIDVDVKTQLSDPKVHLRLTPGPTHLDGTQALSFSRTRADSDYARAARQQQVILALVRKWLDPGLWAMIGSARLLGSLRTDIRLDELPTLVEIGRRSESAQVSQIVLEPPRFSLFVGFEPNSKRGWVMIPNLPAIRAYARSVLSG